MTEELRPISYQGFMTMVHRLWGGGANYYPLHDKALASVEKNEDGSRLIFTLADGRTLTYTAEGDCCSYSWVEHLTVPPDLAGTISTSYSEADMGETEKDYETIRVYQTAFQTPKGEIIVEYRNASNGYYGGWLDGPIEQWALDEISTAREEAQA